MFEFTLRLKLASVDLSMKCGKWDPSECKDFVIDLSTCQLDNVYQQHR